MTDLIERLRTGALELWGVLPAILGAGLIFFTGSPDKLTPDFSAFERYLDLWIAQCGKPRFVVLHVTDVGHRANDGKPAQFKEVIVTVRGTDGRFTQVATPMYAQRPEMWKQLFAGAVERCAKRGIARHQVLIGQGADGPPDKELAELRSLINPTQVVENTTTVEEEATQ